MLHAASRLHLSIHLNNFLDMFAPLCKPNASHNICRIAFACFCSKAWSSKVWEAILGSNSGKQFWAAILGSNLGNNSGSLCTSERVSGEANFGLTLKTRHKRREAIWEAIWEAKWSTTFWAVDTSLIHRKEVRTPYATHVWRTISKSSCRIFSLMAYGTM